MSREIQETETPLLSPKPNAEDGMSTVEAGETEALESRGFGRLIGKALWGQEGELGMEVAQGVVMVVGIQGVADIRVEAREGCRDQ